jgi:lactate racemase
MLRKVKIKYNKKDLYFKINKKNLLYYLEMPKMKILTNFEEQSKIYHALKNPFGTKELKNLLSGKKKVTIVIDDITRPTPQKIILPVILHEIKESGIENRNIKIIVAIGTHRYLKPEEIQKRVGTEIFKQFNILNSEWKNGEKFVNLGKTSNNTPIKVNKEVYHSDFVIGIGSISPHIHAGWSGGSKIIQPGVCDWETTGATHLLAPRSSRLFRIAGSTRNAFRNEVEQIGRKIGLKFIINTILNPEGKIYNVVAGDPIIAHREGVKIARRIFIKPIKEYADIVIVSTYPGEIDYWAGAKAAFLAQRGLKRHGITIIVGAFPEGISSTHPMRESLALKTVDEIEGLIKSKFITDLVCAGDLIMHARLLKRTKIICISGLTKAQKSNLGFKNAESIEEALQMAFKVKGENAKIGVINDGWEILPELNNLL